MISRLLAWCSLAVLSQGALAQQVSPADSDSVDAGLKSIRGAAIRAHMRFLSDSLLEGRAPDSPGYRIAARYVATQLEAMGLRPAGVGGTWFQPVPLRKAVLDTSKSSLALIANGPSPHDHNPVLIDGRDYVLTGDVAHAKYSLDAPVVFVGFGVTAPDERYDDYAGIDVRGKIVLTFSGAPPRFESTVRAYYSDDVEKTKNALAHGAVAMISTLLPEDWQRYPWEWSLPQFRMGNTNWLDSAGAPHDAYASGGVAQFSLSGAKALFANAPKTLEESFAAAQASEHQGFPLPWRARIHTVSTPDHVPKPEYHGRARGVGPGAARSIRRLHGACGSSR